MSLPAVIAALTLLAAQPMSAAPYIDPALLVALNKKQPTEEAERAAQDEAEAVAAQLRDRFTRHPKQRRFWQSIAKRLAALCTRRAGKSDGGVREWLAKAITIKGWRGVYINETLGEARKVVWKNDLGQGWVDLLAQYGTLVPGQSLMFRIGGVLAVVNGTLLTIDFSNGSQIALFGADDEKAINKLRGQAKDEVWIDEAQKFVHLRPMILQVVSPLVKDKRGVIRLTGTPSEDCAGYFYEVTPEPDSGDTPLKGWEVHRWSVVDNPGFGCVAWIEGEWFITDHTGAVLGGPYVDEATAEQAATQIRWDRTAGEALEENGWDGTEPEYQREWLGKWVKSDARYVYPVHAAPQHRLTYAPQRFVDNPVNDKHPPWYDHVSAYLDLPRKPTGRQHQWLYAIGADFGYAEDPFAVAVWAFAQDRSDIFEMFSWKQHKVLPDDQRDYLLDLWRQLDNVVVLVGDPAGQVAANLAGWRERVHLPIDDADKSGKATWQTLMAGDIRKGNVRYRTDSPLLLEHRHLVYLPTKPGKPLKDHADRRTSDGKIHGNHCADSALYAYRHLTHFLHRAPEDRPPPGSREALEIEAARHEAAIDRKDAQRARDDGDRWGIAEESGYGYEY
ncbi:MAG: hypothetical protein ACTHU0_19190 [Kofleriaceae bacterium]